jgi:hypothetical protein
MEDRPMGRKLLVFAASLVILAGCTSNGDGDGDESAQTGEESTGPVVPQVVDGEPIEFAFEAPTGFVLAPDEDRPELVADNHLSYVFALDGGGAGDRIIVTSYVLDAPVPAGEYESLVAVVSAYDAGRGQPSEAEWYAPALVHRMPAVHRYIEVAGDAPVKQYNHYIAVDTHLIQITCQWETNFGAVIDACEQLEQEFPAPAGWQPEVA